MKQEIIRKLDNKTNIWPSGLGRDLMFDEEAGNVKLGKSWLAALYSLSALAKNKNGI